MVLVDIATGVRDNITRRHGKILVRTALIEVAG
jgi:hypothetical protein